MARFSTFPFYVQEFRGALSKCEYESVVERAYTVIVAQTNGKAQTAPSEMHRNLKLCECALVDVISGYLKTEQSLPKGVTSVNNDGYIVSTAGQALIKGQAQEQLAICRSYLQVPLNLMDRWL